MFASALNSLSNAAREFSQLEQLLAPENKQLRQLVFYAESGIYYRYYEDYIEQILAKSSLDVCYVTSAADDPLFQSRPQRLKPFYIKNMLSALFSKLDAKVLVLTAPDINNGPIKRAPEPVHHVYAFHAISSTHQAYRRRAFDHYDSVLCIGQYQIDELRQAELIYGTRKKELRLIGYPLLERIYKEQQQLEQRTGSHGGAPLCLIAPTWGASSILERGIDDILKCLARTDFQVLLRPHPEFMRRSPRKLRAIEKLIEKMPNIKIESNLTSMQSLHQADLLITDHSGISMEYFLGTERPVTFIDTPVRIDNPEVGRLNMEPMENRYRQQMGVCVAPDRLSELPAALNECLQQRERYAREANALRSELVANWQQAASVGADWLLSLCS